MIAENYQWVLDRIAAAARKSGREAEQVCLVVVTKAQPLEIIEQAIAAGARSLGENYVEEAVPKIQALTPARQVEWRMIGHIQSRKAEPVCEYFDWVDSLDSVKLAKRLDRFAGGTGRLLPVLLECNVSAEESKFGWPAWQESDWPRLAGEIEQVLDLPHLQVCGLMTMPPFFADPEEARPYFRRLRRLRDFLALRFRQVEWTELSMGMSADFEVAIQEGATMVRVGTAILGERSR